MDLEFYKYQGTGNDFIMVDNRKGLFEESNLQMVKYLCDRKFGIGSDGLILIKEKEGYDFEMVYFNADGSQSMCGNGARCAVAFSRFLGIVDIQCRFYAIDGPHEATYRSDRIELGMKSVQEVSPIGSDYFVDTGSPHYVRFVDGIKNYPVVEEGTKIRYSSGYPEGTNVNFVGLISEDELYVRTYERGVENETLSCGTGVTACALVAGKINGRSDIKIQTLGGNLQVRFVAEPDGSFRDILLIGPTEQVFRGIIAL